MEEHTNMPNVNETGEQPKRRAVTAESMAAKQRDISVSEFFAKNRHLLGFDNPRKALLTAVKEAVDNSLDACEEAGIVPEIWVHIEPTAANRFKVGIQDNGPGIVKKQIPLIFGKLLYGSKFHRLRMSRGQQGIGISAAGMYGMLTTGKPVKIISKLSPRKPAHYFELQIDTKRNMPEIINGKGEGIDIDGGKKFHDELKKHEIDFDTHYAAPEGKETSYDRSTKQLPPEPKEIKPHPYGIELGRLVTMLKDTDSGTMSAFLTESFSRVSSSVARKICEEAKITTRANPKRIGRQEADSLYQAIQNTRISSPATDCLVPIGEQLILKGLAHVVPGEFYCAATRPPAVYRGNPFLIEVGLAYGGVSPAQKVSLDALTEMLSESDARTLRQFLMNSFDGLGSEAADKILTQAQMGTRQSPGRLKKDEIAQLHAAMKNVNLSEGQSMQVFRYANRVPLQFQPAACAITQSVIGNNWRSYGLSQSRGNLPQGPVTVMVHMASVWVPFTSESKEAIASYPEITKELRLGLQAVGRKLAIYLNRRKRVAQEGERREIFLRYLGEVATAVTAIKDSTERSKKDLYGRLLQIAKRKTSEADTVLDDRGKKVDSL